MLCLRLHVTPSQPSFPVSAGTDPTEGSALGIALLQALVRGGPGGAGLTVASTHHGALTALKYEDERFENSSGECCRRLLRPTNSWGRFKLGRWVLR